MNSPSPSIRRKRGKTRFATVETTEEVEPSMALPKVMLSESSPAA
jgi:hypothetical protein